MSAVVLLDAGPLGILAHPKNPPHVLGCRNWAKALQAAGRRVLVPEIADYEVRRELVRLKKNRSVFILDGLASQFEYLPLSTTAMRRAADLWAQARQQGRPTAPDPALDADVILAAQALTLGVPQVVIATSNVGHLAASSRRNCGRTSCRRASHVGSDRDPGKVASRRPKGTRRAVHSGLRGVTPHRRAAGAGRRRGQGVDSYRTGPRGVPAVVRRADADLRGPLLFLRRRCSGDAAASASITLGLSRRPSAVAVSSKSI